MRGRRTRSRAAIVGILGTILASATVLAHWWTIASGNTITRPTSALYVSTAGSDNNTGTLSSPLKTIDFALTKANPGSIIYVMGGIYHQYVHVHQSGTSTGYTTVRNYRGQTPVLDGTGLSVDPASGDQEIVEIKNANFITFEGFEIRNMTASSATADAMGIWVRGSDSHVNILDNTIHNITTPFENDNGNALGIYMEGTSGQADGAIRDINIKSNNLYDMKLGWSESLAIAGNVNHFVVSNNKIHDNDNIGIVMQGGYKQASNPAVDRARNGVVSDNLVYNISSDTNPAYSNQMGADGIYVDGGSNILVQRNNVRKCDIGVEFASELHGWNTHDDIASDNFIYDSNLYGISIGGYDEKRGSAYRCHIFNNRLYNDDTTGKGAQIELQNYATGNVINNNKVYAGVDDMFVSNDGFMNKDDVFDHNLYYCIDGNLSGKWRWQGQTYQGLGAFQKATGQDPHSRFGNPHFVAPM